MKLSVVLGMVACGVLVGVSCWSVGGRSEVGWGAGRGEV